MGNTGHVFDELAPRLRDRFRIVAVTRRGFGASTRAASGYDTRTLANDVLAVMDSLRIRRAVLVGHSFGGAEVTWLAVHHPERVLALALLESYCYGCRPIEDVPRPPDVRAVGPPPPRPENRASLAAWGAFASARTGAPLPPGEVLAATPGAPDRHVTTDTAAARVMMAIRREMAASDFGSVRVPALLVLGLPSRAEDLLWWMEHPDPESLHRAAVWLPTTRAVKLGWARRFMALVPTARVAFVPHAPHHVFLSDPERVAEAIRDLADRAAGAGASGNGQRARRRSSTAPAHPH